MEGLGQLFSSVSGVLVLDPVVPGPKAQMQLRALALLEGAEAGDQLLPEPGRGPMLNGVRRTLGHDRVVRAVEPQQFVAEEQRGGRTVPALAQFGETQPEGR